MDADNLTGRELDAAVAERVFGLEVQEHPNARTRQKDYLRRDHDEQWLRVSYYSTSLAAGLSVNERLGQLGWKVNEATSNRRPDPTGLYRVDLTGPNGQQVFASGTSWELALARAALKAASAEQ